MSSDELTAIATIRLYPSESGGKTHAIHTGYRPNHNFGSPENHLAIGQVYSEPDQPLSPGASSMALIRFFPTPELRDSLHVGTTWLIQEGPYIVGEARCEEIRDA